MADENELTGTSPFVDPFTDTVDEIRGRMLDSVVEQYPDETTRPDTREGSLLWTALAAAAVVAAEQYAHLNEALELSFVQTSRDVFLDYRGAELGVTRLAATGSAGFARFMGEGGATIPLGATVSTATEDPSEDTFVYTTQTAGTIVALPDPTDEPVPTEGAAGSTIVGDVVYKFVYVTYLNEFLNSRGFTLPSPAPVSALSVATTQVDVEVPTMASQAAYAGWDIYDPVNPALVVKEVRVYRSYRLPSAGSTDFSEYKLIGKIQTNPELGGTVVDDVNDADFELIDGLGTGTGSIPDFNTTGLVDIAVVSQAVGSGTNGLVGAIQLLDDDIPGVEAVSNAASLTGGSDAETDFAFAARILEEARKAAGAGNVDDYIGWAKSISGIFGVNVVPEWDGPGTVRVVISGLNNEPLTDPVKVEEVRQFIAGDIAIEDPATAIPTLTPSSSGGTILAGTYRYVYTYVNSGGGETLPSPVSPAITTTGSTSSVTLVDIPTGPTGVGPISVDKVRVYRKRTTDPTPTYKLVDEVSNVEDAPSSGTIADIVDTTPQASLDPRTTRNGNSTSLYNGVAPVGAHVTVETIETVAIYVTADILPKAGYTLTGEANKVALLPKLTEAIAAYFATLGPGTNVKYMDVLNAIHDTEGVDDITNMEVIGATANVSIDDNKKATYDIVNSVFTEVV